MKAYIHVYVYTYNDLIKTCNQHFCKICPREVLIAKTIFATISQPMANPCYRDLRQHISVEHIVAKRMISRYSDNMSRCIFY